MSAVALNAVRIPELPAPTDAELIERFVVAHDQTAFAELVRRHSSVVLGVCRRVLHDPHEIEDVFQATFLVLVRDASHVRKRQSLASWLYGVAYRISLRVARNKLRRRETMLVDETLIVDDTLGKMTDRHDQQLVDIELNALPERYRQPLVMKYLSGRSVDQIATELGTTVGSVEGLLKRGKDELRRRLLQRGITLGTALAAIQITQQVAQASAADSMIELAIQAGLAWNGQPHISPPSVVSDRAVELAAKEMIAMTTTTKTAIAVGLTVGGLVIGMGGASLYLEHGGSDAQAAPLVTTMSISGRARESLELATLTAEPIPQSGTSKPGPKSINDKVLDEATLGREADRRVLSVAGELPASESHATSDPIVKWDFRKRSTNELRIEKALESPTEVQFFDQSLKDSLNYLQDLHHIEILVDSAALEDAGIGADQKVNLTLSGGSLKNTLRLLLDPMHLDYVIKNEVMMITTREKADEIFETRVYNVGLLPEYTPEELMEVILLTVDPEGWNVDASMKSFPQANKPIPETAESRGTGGMPEIIGGTPGKTSRGDDSMLALSHSQIGMGGGMGGGGFAGDSAMGVIRVSKKTLVIRQKPRIHDEIVELLNQLK